jgi:hypothetical protein
LLLLLQLLLSLLLLLLLLLPLLLPLLVFAAFPPLLMLFVETRLQRLRLL